MTIRHKLFFSYGIMVVLIVLIAVASTRSMFRWQTAAENLSIAREQSELAERFRIGIERQIRYGLDFIDGVSETKNDFLRIEKELTNYLEELKSKSIDPVESDHIEGLEETKFELEWIANNLFQKVSSSDSKLNLESAHSRLDEISDEVVDDIITLNQYYRSRVQQTVIDASKAGTFALVVTAFSMALALVQLIILIYLTQKWLAKPIESVNRATMAISSGDFNARVDLTENNEWGILAISINEMARSLKNYRSRVRIQEKLAVLGEAAAYTAHNIQNPLAGIRAAAQVTLNNANQSKSDIDQCLNDIIGSVDRLDLWVKRFLNYAKPLELRKEPTDLNQQIDEISTLTYRKFSGKGIELQSNLDNNLKDVFVDQLLIQQALSAILTNSFESNGNNVCIKTENLADDTNTNSVMITVTDNGSGISEDMKNGLFTSFKSNKVGGTGLGLAQAKKIVELHGGEISFRSKIGEGTSFFIKIPCNYMEILQRD